MFGTVLCFLDCHVWNSMTWVIRRLQCVSQEKSFSLEQRMSVKQNWGKTKNKTKQFFIQPKEKYVTVFQNRLCSVGWCWWEWFQESRRLLFVVISPFILVRQYAGQQMLFLCLSLLQAFKIATLWTKLEIQRQEVLVSCRKKSTGLQTYFQINNKAAYKKRS